MHHTFYTKLKARLNLFDVAIVFYSFQKQATVDIREQCYCDNPIVL